MENSDLIRDWYQQVWNGKNEAYIDKYLAANCIAHGLLDENNEEIIGPEKFKGLYRKFIASFPDIKFTILHVINEGNKTAALVEATFTHKGEPFEAFTGKKINASGNSVTLTGMTLTIIENNQIQEAWNCFDFLTMYATLGAVQVS